MLEGINGLPYLEAFMAGVLVMIVLFRIVAGREVFMSILFGEEDPKTKKEPTRNRASKA